MFNLGGEDPPHVAHTGFAVRGGEGDNAGMTEVPTLTGGRTVDDRCAPLGAAFPEIRRHA